MANRTVLKLSSLMSNRKIRMITNRSRRSHLITFAHTRSNYIIELFPNFPFFNISIRCRHCSRQIECAQIENQKWTHTKMIDWPVWPFRRLDVCRVRILFFFFFFICVYLCFGGATEWTCFVMGLSTENTHKSNTFYWHLFSTKIDIIKFFGFGFRFGAQHASLCFSSFFFSSSPFPMCSIV